VRSPVREKDDALGFWMTWWPLLVLGLAAIAFLGPVGIAVSIPQRALAKTAKVDPGIAKSALGKRLVGTWRSVGENGFPDMTLYADGGIKFGKKSANSTNSKGCSTEDVTSWGIADSSSIYFNSKGKARPVIVEDLYAGDPKLKSGPVDPDAVRLRDVDSGKVVYLVRASVFDNVPVLLIHGINIVNGINPITGPRQEGDAQRAWAKWFNADSGLIKIASSDWGTLFFVRSPETFGSKTPVFVMDYSATTRREIVANSAMVPWAIDEMRKVCDPKGKQEVKPFVVGHSLGGLLTRTYMESLGASGSNSLSSAYRDDILGLCTIGTPHGGSFLVQDVVGILSKTPDSSGASKEVRSGEAGAQMNPNSDYYRLLNGVDLPTAPRYSSVIGHISKQLVGSAVGDGVVTVFAQEPYRSPDCAGGSEQRYNQFLANHPGYKSVEFNVSHVPGLGGEGSETDSSLVLDWVCARYHEIQATVGTKP
jgi:hypothetical protein